jgi:AcrR family transcriptional regulator
MPRARAGILDAAAQLVAEHGLHAVTMVGVARRAGVAKATVYNHVRDRDELVAALLADQWRQLKQLCSDQPRDQRLTTAATWVSDSPVLAGLRRYNPDALVTLGGVAVTDPQVAATVNTWIPEGRDSDAALRWLISFAIAPHPLTPEPQILDQSD